MEIKAGVLSCVLYATKPRRRLDKRGGWVTHPPNSTNQCQKQTCHHLFHEPVQEKIISVLGKFPIKNGPIASSNAITRTFFRCFWQ
jgi:hypothetical protein